MAELSLKDRLQPALLDRLTDDERTLTVFRLTLDAGLLREHGLTEADLEPALALQVQLFGVTFAGKRSLTVGAVTALGPALLTTIV